MDKSERQKEILNSLKANSTVSVADLGSRLGVSEMTIRRDLHELDREGLLRRVHGGAILGAGRSLEPPYKTRAAENIDQKRAIAQKAATYVVDGDSIALDIGTTIMEMIVPLKDRLDLSVVTASLPIATAIMENFRSNSGLRLILTGGIVRPGELSLIGNLSQNTYKELHVDKAFIGVGAISLEEGFTEYNLDDTYVKKALTSSAGQVIVLADGSKFGRSSFASIGPLSMASVIITDPSAPVELVEQIRKQGVEVVIAD